MNHRVQIIAVLDRAKGVCSCGTMNSSERFGDRRTATAKADVFKHLESVYKTADDENVQQEYQIKDGSPLDCPLCSDPLDLREEDKGLLMQNAPSVIACENGHEWDAYYQKKALFLFLSAMDGPFSTW